MVSKATLWHRKLENARDVEMAQMAGAIAQGCRRSIGLQNEGTPGRASPFPERQELFWVGVLHLARHLAWRMARRGRNFTRRIALPLEKAVR